MWDSNCTETGLMGLSRKGADVHSGSLRGCCPADFWWVSVLGHNLTAEIWLESGVLEQGNIQNLQDCSAQGTELSTPALKGKSKTSHEDVDVIPDDRKKHLLVARIWGKEKIRFLSCTRRLPYSLLGSVQLQIETGQMRQWLHNYRKWLPLNCAESWPAFFGQKEDAGQNREQWPWACHQVSANRNGSYSGQCSLKC